MSAGCTGVGAGVANVREEEVANPLEKVETRAGARSIERVSDMMDMYE